MLALKRKVPSPQVWPGDGEHPRPRSPCLQVMTPSCASPHPPGAARCRQAEGGNGQSGAQAHAVLSGPFCPSDQVGNSPPLYRVSYSFPPPGSDACLYQPAKRLRYLSSGIAANEGQAECEGAHHLGGAGEIFTSSVAGEREDCSPSYNHSSSLPASTSAFSLQCPSSLHSAYPREGPVQAAALLHNGSGESCHLDVRCGEAHVPAARSVPSHSPAGASSMCQKPTEAVSGRPNGNSFTADFHPSPHRAEVCSSAAEDTESATDVVHRDPGSGMSAESMDSEGTEEDKREQQRRLWTSENVSIGALLFGMSLSRRRTSRRI